MIKPLPIALAGGLLAILVAPPSGRADPLKDAVTACRAIDADRERLLCYDGIDGETAMSMTEDRTAKAPFTTGEPDEDRFGFGPRLEPESDEKERVMDVAEARKTPRGDWLLIMKNGQVWRQTDNVRLPTLRPDMTAKVKKGAMGGYILTITGRSFRAKRLE